MAPYVCAFRGRRDSYQVPLALAESSLLDQFITDAYATRGLRAIAPFLPESIRSKINLRAEAGIPPDRVHCLWMSAALEQLRHRLGFRPIVTHHKIDRNFSRAAARRAFRSKADLFLYSPYAWEAFTAHYRHHPRKVLFQYHPHPDLQERILVQDSARHPNMGESFSVSNVFAVPRDLYRRERDAWKHADLILCTSSFTLRSLIAAGADERICRIVPYGIDLPPRTHQPTGAEFNAIFVGSGAQRKGLHHLLLAWQRATLPPKSKLTLVCRRIDRGIEQLARSTTSVELLRGVSQDRLASLYARSTLFVMPSLVEGFGQVYLEALAQGCPVLGTPNTCLPDLGTETDGMFLSSVGDIEQLAARLTELVQITAGNAALRDAARNCAAKFTWPAFRAGIMRAIRV
jgi:glycosyltransferase involved in cell wall biosynthesis